MLNIKQGIFIGILFLQRIDAISMEMHSCLEFEEFSNQFKHFSQRKEFVYFLYDDKQMNMDLLAEYQRQIQQHYCISMPPSSKHSHVTHIYSPALSPSVDFQPHNACASKGYFILMGHDSELNACSQFNSNFPVKSNVTCDAKFNCFSLFVLVRSPFADTQANTQNRMYFCGPFLCIFLLLRVKCNYLQH